MTGIKLDSSGLDRAGKRAALMAVQAGLCAACGHPGCPCADHDHWTGLLRGLLCRSCNNREGRSDLRELASADIAAYLAAPPAAGRGWMWELPDWWTAREAGAVQALGCTVLEYVTARPDLGERIAAARLARATAVMQAAELPPL